MEEKYLLAVIDKDEPNHYLLKQFEDSLPKGSKIIFGTFLGQSFDPQGYWSYKGSYKKELDYHKNRLKYPRIIKLFQLPAGTDTYLNESYFDMFPESELIDIQDELYIHFYVNTVREKKNPTKAEFQQYGSITESMNNFHELISKDAQSIFKNILIKGWNYKFEDFLIPHKRKKTTIKDSVIEINLETKEGIYILDTNSKWLRGTLEDLALY